MKIANFYFLLQMVVMLLLCLTAVAATNYYPCSSDADCQPPRTKCRVTMVSWEFVKLCGFP